MVLIKEIELALKPKETEVVGQEDDVLVDSVLDLENINLTQQDGFEDCIPGSIRKQVEADMRVAYPGKPTSRKRIFKSSSKKEKSENPPQINYESDDSDIEDELLSDGIGEQLSVEGEEQLSEEEEKELSDEEEEQFSDEEAFDESYFKRKIGSDSDDDDDDDSEDADESSDFGGSIEGFKKDDEQSEDEDKIKLDDPQGIAIFSARARDIQSDIAKGKSIRNQLTIWEKLIECRIKLQPGLINTNKLFQCDALKDFKKQLNSEEEEIINQTYSVLSDLMKGLLELQDITLNASPEYKEIKALKRKNDGTTKEEPEMKKIKSTDFLQEIHDEFKPFRDAVIQKWNEKTRLSHGRMSKSDFSAFDQPTLKQIEEILLDRERLLRRTRTKRSDYQVLGKATLSSDEAVKNDNSRVKDLQEYDPEIFDDDDFYHKLLRDFIDNKTSDASDVSKRGKQWLELQKLRSRMKAKVDTRASKGRKIRYTVHNKMVNFMAPVPSYSWTDGAKNELFKSLFGQTVQQAV